MSRTTLRWVLAVIATVAATAVVIAGAVVLLRGGSDTGAETGAAPGPGGTPAQPSAAAPSTAHTRPNCPGTGVGGVELPCLGGEAQAGAPDAEITLVDVWAWWCEPCRRELPVIQQYADAHPETRVVGVHADSAEANGIALLDELKVDLASYQDSDNTFASTLGLPGVVPITLVYRGDTQVAVFPRTFDTLGQLEDAIAGVM